VSARKVDVRFFASLTEHVGANLITIDVEPRTSVASLWDRLVERHPALAGLSYRPMVACDLVYAQWDRLLDDVDEVAFLPPVSGG